jgi:hypothetical protein
MGFRFRRSMKLLPGVRLNLGARSASLSLGGRGAHVTVGSRGTRSTVGIPGTGLSFTSQRRAQGVAEGGKPSALRTVVTSILLALCLLVIATMVLTQK